MSRLISKYVGGGIENLNWIIQEMDVTQWGIVAVIFVVIGFVALKTNF